MLIYALLAGLVMFTFWVMVIYSLWSGRLPGATPANAVKESTFATRAVGLQLLMAALCTGFALARDHVNALTWAFFAPILAPVSGLWLWGTYHNFLAVPLLAAVAISVTAAAAWYSLLPGKPRALLPGIATVTFVAGLIAAGQFQFHRDVLAAAQVLQPDCIDSTSIADALSQAQRYSSRPYAWAVKGADAYGWSFRTRSFYKLPDSVKHNVGPPRYVAFTSPFPSCWQEGLWKWR